MLLNNIGAVEAAVNKKLGPKPCPMCSKTSGFTIDLHENHEASLDRNEKGVSPTGDHRFIPCAMMVCNNCGYVVKFVLEKLLDNPKLVSTSISK